MARRNIGPDDCRASGPTPADACADLPDGEVNQSGTAEGRTGPPSL